MPPILPLTPAASWEKVPLNEPADVFDGPQPLQHALSGGALPPVSEEEFHPEIVVGEEKTVYTTECEMISPMAGKYLYVKITIHNCNLHVLINHIHVA